MSLFYGLKHCIPWLIVAGRMPVQVGKTVGKTFSGGRFCGKLHMKHKQPEKLNKQNCLVTSGQIKPH